jgi:bisphosphoglycerate-independent phosphoglycerate mutase (AlkP superfamily)
MTHILMIFLDGIGLGDDDPTRNPFAIAHMPTLTALTNGKRWLRGIGRQESERAIFIPTDPRMGVPGRPQSASGQATIVTGRIIPQLIGEHYGPKPNAAIRKLLAEDNFFKQVVAHGKKAAIINAYPPRLHNAINRGKILRSSYQQALHEGGLPMFGDDKIYDGSALSSDWTGEGWRSQLGYTDTPVYSRHEAGRRMVEISRRYDFAFFSHWYTDIVGHRGPLEDGVALLELFDGVMAGALDAWDDGEGLMIVTSDHGNLEDVSSRNHTENDVPTLIIGRDKAAFAEGLTDLTGFVPRMARLLFGE